MVNQQVVNNFVNAIEESTADKVHTHVLGDILKNAAIPDSSITNPGDLNSYVDVGIWTCTGDNSENLSNKPFIGKRAFILENKQYSDGNIVQLCFVLNSNVSYNRIYYRVHLSSGGGTWVDNGAWKELADTSQIAIASSTTPKAAGVADVGSETSSFARGDHVHPIPARSAVQSLTVNSPFSGTVRWCSRNGWAIVYWQGLTSSQTSSDFRTVALLPESCPIVIYEPFNSNNTSSKGMTFRVESTNLAARCYDATAKMSGYIMYPL